MNKEEQEKTILAEVKQRYDKFFEETKDKVYKDETEALQEEKEFHEEIIQYINKRKRKLEKEGTK